MGRLADRFGIVVPVIAGAMLLGAGYIAVGHARAVSGSSRSRKALIGSAASAPSGR